VTFLPIVERELRVAARRRMTYWLRILAAITALIIAGALFTLFTNVPGGFGAQPGGPLFAVLTWMSLIVALTAGLFFTSDALSEERREGTLGFLFLTDLRGYDVVLGKLLATSCRCVFALFAIFPILAATQLLGGVEGGEFWRTILALVHTLLFSLTVGIFVSAVSQHPQKALVGTLGLLLLVVAGTAAGDALLAFINNKPYRALLSLASPVTVFMNSGRGLPQFWSAFLTSGIMIWVLLVATCWLIPRTWQQPATRVVRQQADWRKWLRFGSERRRRQLRFVLLDRNPLTWLACRERWQAIFLWALVAVLLGWFAVASLLENFLVNWTGWQAVVWLATLFLYLWTASQASQFFAEARRGGLLELLLSTSLNFSSVSPGAWRGLLRLFGVPLGLVLLIQFAASVTMLPGRFSFGGSEPLPQWVMVWGAAGLGLVVSVANFVALAWFGLWMGLVSRNGLIATLKTVVFVQIIPWMVIGFASWMVLPLLAIFNTTTGGSKGPAAWMMWYPIISTCLMTVLTLLKDFIFWQVARRKLVGQFRAVATQALVPSGRVRFAGSPPPPPVFAPPVHPPRPAA